MDINFLCCLNAPTKINKLLLHVMLGCDIIILLQKKIINKRYLLQNKLIDKYMTEIHGNLISYIEK